MSLAAWMPSTFSAGVQAADRDNPNVFDAHLGWSAGRVQCFVPPHTGG